MTVPPSPGPRARRAALALACTLVAGLLTGGPAHAAGSRQGPATVEELSVALDEATRAGEQAADDVFQAANRSFDLRRRIDEAATRHADAQDALDDRLRDIYINGRRDPVTTLLLGVDGNHLSVLANVQRAGVRTDEQLLRDVQADTAVIAALQKQAATDRAALLSRARRVYELQDRARRLLLRAEVALVADRAALAVLATHRATLDVQSRAVSVAVQPAVTVRGSRAAAAEAPVIAALEAAGANFPPGYRATGRIIAGEASWYGPGFVGNPTASGAPYDPERLTAAMLAVPLGTVVRVTTADGRAVNVLVNDRGPYKRGRIIDMSAAGARMLDFTGVKAVRVEVLEPLP